MTSLSNLYRDLTCAAAATVITLVLSMSFVQSTTAAPFHVSPATHTQSA